MHDPTKQLRRIALDRATVATRSPWRRALAVGAGLLLASSCAALSPEAQLQRDVARLQAQFPGRQSQNPRQAAQDASSINTIEYRASAKYPDAAQWVQDNRELETASRILNVSGPHPTVAFVAEDCGEANAYYQHSTRTVRLCYELVNLVQAQFGNTATGSGVITFVLDHEIAHAQIHLYDLAIVGREEDAADQYGALLQMLPAARADSDNIRVTMAEHVLAAAQFFRVIGAKAPAWGEHAIGDVRYFNLLCLIYGNVTELRDQIATELPTERASRCNDEYRQAKHGWDTLLAPYAQ